MIYYHPYQLHTTHPLNSRETARSVSGVLLRHEDGVGCLQPWPNLGDAPLDYHLAKLSAGEITPLTQRALDCCRWDGAARRAQVSLFTNQTIPLSHATLTQFPTPEACAALTEAGFTHVKIKTSGTDTMLVEKLASLTTTGLRLRLDFNHSLTPTLFLTLLAQLSEATKAQLDFIEDPFPYDSNLWHAAEQATGISLALDRHDPVEWDGIHPAHEHRLQVSIWKPATEARPRPALRTVVTSNMDHAIGQMYAAAMAAHHGITEICGFLTHGLFQPDDFFSLVQSSGPALQAPAGTGLGFDDLIDKLPWKRLS